MTVKTALDQTVALGNNAVAHKTYYTQNNTDFLYDMSFCEWNFRLLNRLNLSFTLHSEGLKHSL